MIAKYEDIDIDSKLIVVFITFTEHYLFVARHVSNGIISIHQLYTTTGCWKLSAQMEFACDESKFEHFQLVQER